MGQDNYLPLEKSGQSVIDRNLPYRLLRGQPLKLLHFHSSKAVQSCSTAQPQLYIDDRRGSNSFFANSHVIINDCPIQCKIEILLFFILHQAPIMAATRFINAHRVFAFFFHCIVSYLALYSHHLYYSSNARNPCLRADSIPTYHFHR